MATDHPKCAASRRRLNGGAGESPSHPTLQRHAAIPESSR